MSKKIVLKGFTLVEVIVVIAVVGLLLPVLFGIIFSLLRLQYEVSQLQRLKEVGDYATNQMAYVVRQNAKSIDIDDDCYNQLFLSGINDYLFFKDSTGQCLGFYIENNVLKQADYLSGSANTVDLISSSDSDFSIVVEDTSQFSANNDLAKVKLVLTTDSQVSYVNDETLTYRFYLYLRK